MATREWMPNRKQKRETTDITVSSESGSANTISTNINNDAIQILVFRDSGAVNDAFRVRITETSTGAVLHPKTMSTDGLVVFKPGAYLLGQITFEITDANADGTYKAVIDYK